MRRIILRLGALLVLTSYSRAQFKQGDIELSFSGSLGSWTTSSTSNGRTSSDSRAYVFFAVTPGYYIVDGLSIEAELGLLAVEKMTPTEYLLGDISYTYRLPDSKVALFARVGYGFSNSAKYPMFGDALIKTSNELDVGVVNIGGGLKYIVSEGVALRAEINYRSHSWTSEYRGYGGSSSKTEYTYSNIGLLLGFSVLL